MSKLNSSKVIAQAQNVFQIESEALFKISERIDDRFAQAIESLLHAPKVVVVGVGKSAHIGKKVVATFNSTGTVSQYLHATEAIHGDLGLVQNGDVVIAVSKSGNTPEVKTILPYLKNRASKVIAITGNAQSYLANNADIVLDVAIEKEACPNQLAPTTSTTAQLAMGDALAVVLMQQRGFKSHDFAKFHPGGALGKNLLMKVKDVIPNKENPQVNPDDAIPKVIESLSYAKNGMTVLVKEQKVIGVITDGDMRRMLTKHTDFSGLKAIDIASTSPKVVQEETLAKEAFAILKKYNIGQLVVLNNNEAYVGILDIHDLLNEGIS